MVAGMAVAPRAAAQQPSSRVTTFASVGFVSDLNAERFPSVAGGAVVDLVHARIAVGAQAHVFFSPPYAAGRGVGLVQGTVFRNRAGRIFLLGGQGFGEESGPMVGGGVTIGPERRVALRLTIEDYLARIGGFDCGRFGYSPSECAARHDGRSFTAHQLSAYVGIAW
jgi:hypothetical protein